MEEQKRQDQWFKWQDRWMVENEKQEVELFGAVGRGLFSPTELALNQVCLFVLVPNFQPPSQQSSVVLDSVLTAFLPLKSPGCQSTGDQVWQLLIQNPPSLLKICKLTKGAAFASCR